MCVCVWVCLGVSVGGGVHRIYENEEQRWALGEANAGAEWGVWVRWGLIIARKPENNNSGYSRKGSRVTAIKTLKQHAHFDSIKLV